MGWFAQRLAPPTLIESYSGQKPLLRSVAVPNLYSRTPVSAAPPQSGAVEFVRDVCARNGREGGVLSARLPRPSTDVQLAAAALASLRGLRRDAGGRRRCSACSEAAVLLYVCAVDDSHDLESVIEKSHDALDAFLRGDPSPLQALFSQRYDVTLANPFGPAQRGWPQVRDTMARAAEHYRDGRVLGFDRIATHVTPEIACIHELERLEAKMGGSDERTPVSLRCTSVLRLEDGGWRIVHRHADPISGTRPADSVVQK
jgi:ketosteroid isomerase-like protein